MGLISLIALILAIVIGYLRKINTGLLSIGFAFLVGYFVVGMQGSEIISGWPLKLFFILLGMTLLFSIATVNGTLKIIADRVVYLTGSNRKLLPIVFFIMSGILAALGPGNICICALVLPIAMTVSSEEKISPLLMATMVIAGANAGGLSPIAPAGIIGVTLAREQGLNIGVSIFVKQVIGQSIFAAILYFLFKGHKLKPDGGAKLTPLQFNMKQKLTLLVSLLAVCGIVFGHWDIGLTAFSGAIILILLKVVKEEEAIASVPWSTLILVCGVGMLVNVCREAGGMELLIKFLSSLMNARTAAPIMALSGGVMSLFSSASGVVMPTLIPTAPRLATEVGGDPGTIISAIIMGAHMATNSPLSTLGALVIASASQEDKESLFRKLLIVGVTAVFYAAVIVYIKIV